jgi:hypothetical protein
MMEAARTSESPIDIQLRTWQYIPEDSELHTRRRENLKSHTALMAVRKKGATLMKIQPDSTILITSIMRSSVMKETTVHQVTFL